MNSRNQNPDKAALTGEWSMVDGVPVFAQVSAHQSHSSITPVPTPVVLLAGLALSSRCVAPAAAYLARDHWVYAVDLPGFGQSGKPARALDVPELADWLVRWMEAAGVNRAVLLGHSFGSQVAVDLALRYPSRIERLVLVGPTLDPRARALRDLVPRWWRDTRHDPLRLRLLHLADVFSAGPRRALQTLQYMRRDRIERKLPQIAVPALVVRGEHDQIAPQDWAEEVAHRLPCAQLAVLPGAPHADPYLVPRALDQVVRSYLRDAGKDA